MNNETNNIETNSQPVIFHGDTLVKYNSIVNMLLLLCTETSMIIHRSRCSFIACCHSSNAGQDRYSSAFVATVHITLGQKRPHVISLSIRKAVLKNSFSMFGL